MEFVRKLIVASLLLTQMSCVSLISLGLTPLKPNCGKEKIFIKNNTLDRYMKTNGFYIGDNGGLFFLYENGLFYLYNPFTPKYNEYLNDKEKVLKNIEKNIIESKLLEFWGEYNITDTSITMRYFAKQNSGMCKTIVLGMDGTLLNDSTIRIYDDYHYVDDKQVTFKEFKNNKTYHFQSFDIKPDSSKAWFLDKKWYKKRVK